MEGEEDGETDRGRCGERGGGRNGVRGEREAGEGKRNAGLLLRCPLSDACPLLGSWCGAGRRELAWNLRPLLSHRYI